jgi:hypothetical protein
MLSFLKDIRIRSRVLIVVFLPLLGFLAFSGLTVVQQGGIASSMSELKTLADLAPEISSMVHELQKERGNSAGFIGSKGSGKFRDRLTKQLSETNQARDIYMKHVKAFDFDAYDPALKEKFTAAGQMLAQLDDKRAQVSSLSINVPGMAKY